MSNGIDDRDSSPAVQVSNLTKRYGSGDDAVTAVDDVSFSIEPGTVTGVLGPNGAGKTTTIKMALGLITPDEGRVEINGVNVGESPREIYGEVSAMLEGTRNAYWRLSVRENLYFFSSMHGIDPNDHREEHDELIRKLGLVDKADEPVRNLSRGMKQKVSLASVLVQHTPVVFLDEPTLGLDVDATRDLCQELERLSSEDRTIILSSHDLDVVQELCDRVIILSEGEVLTDDRVEDLLSVFETQTYRFTIDRRTANVRRRLESRFRTESWEESGDGASFEVLLNGHEEFYELTRLLEDEGVLVTDVESLSANLEQAFLELTRENEATVEASR